MLDRTDRSLVGVWWWTVDRWLLASALLLMVVGTLLVMAAGPAVATLINLPSQHFGMRQGIFLVPAVGIMITVSLLEPRPIRALALLGLAGIVCLMVLAVVAGSEIKGATRWINIAGFNLQPSEFAKPLFAVVSAWLLTLWREGQDFPGWIYSSLLMAVIVGILVLQPDIGMTLMIVLTWGFQMFLAGMPMLLVICIIALAPLGLFIAYLTLDHVELRIEKFIEGGAWQVEQAKAFLCQWRVVWRWPRRRYGKASSSRCAFRLHLCRRGRGIRRPCLSDAGRALCLHRASRLCEGHVG
jgi:cell division protein FtsW